MLLRAIFTTFPKLAPATLTTRTAVAMSLLFLTAIWALAMVSFKSFRKQTVELIVEQQQRLVGRIADNLDQQLLSLQKGLSDSALEITYRDLASRESAQRYLDSNVGLASAFDRSVFLFSATGDLLAERPFRNRKGNASWRPYFKKTIATRRSIISEPFVSNVGDSNVVIVLTAPVFDADGHLIGVLTGSIGLTHPTLLGHIETTVVGKTGYLYVVTGDGKLIMHPQKERLSQRAFAPNANDSFERALKGYEATAETTEPNGRQALVTYERVASASWVVAAVYPKDEAFQAVEDLLQQFVPLLLLTCLVVLAATWGLARYVLSPLIILTRHIRNYSATQGRIEPLHVGAGGTEIRDLRDAFNNLTKRLHLREDAFVKAMESYQLITDNSTDLITKHSLDGRITYVSPVSESMLGVPPTELVKHALSELVHPEDYAVVSRAFAGAIETKGFQTVTYRVRHQNQQYFWFESKLRLMMSATGEETMEVLCISRNISERKRMEERLHLLARTDHLTDLPNRVLLNERFNEAFIRGRREDSQVALMIIDLDRFKNINDTLGHDKGDELLKILATKLTACVKQSDTLARWGGDEFVLLLPGLQDVDTAIDIANRCLSVLRQPVTIDGQALHFSGSIGLTLWSSFSASSEEMLKEADIAMYKAKKRGGDCLVVYAAEMNTRSLSRLSLENGLFQAIENDELLLHYQPLISGVTGRLSGVEALVRWNHPTLGLVTPGEFIPIAEENGFIVPLGNWVLRTACAQLMDWINAGMEPVPISVNLSGRQFCNDGLLSTIKAILDDTGLDPSLLELEITETALMEDVAGSKSILAALKSLGVHIALDDFGIGYSSLNYLSGLQIDTLKIDRAFTVDVTTNETNSSIVRATLTLAKGMHLRTVAEGVETPAQARFLMAHGCDVLQGYLFAKPMPAEDLQFFALASHTYLLSRKTS